MLAIRTSRDRLIVVRNQYPPYGLPLHLNTDANRFSATFLLSYIILYIVCTNMRTKGCTDWQGPITAYNEVPTEAS